MYPLFEVLCQCFRRLYPLFEVLLCLFGYAGLVVRRLNLSARPVPVKTSIHSHIFLDSENLCIHVEICPLNLIYTLRSLSLSHLEFLLNRLKQGSEPRELQTMANRRNAAGVNLPAKRRGHPNPFVR